MSTLSAAGHISQRLEYMIERPGEGQVGLGSDFDGPKLPEAIVDVAGLGSLRYAMRAHGYGEALITKLAHENCIPVLAKTWREDRA